MKSLRIVLAAILLLLFCGASLAGVSVRPAGTVLADRPKWIAGEIVVKFKNGVSEDRIDRVNQRHATAVLDTSPFAGFKRIKVPAGKTAEEMVEVFNGEASVEYAELNYYAYALFVPNDTYYSYQWHLNDATAGINVEPAWDITFGDPNVIVAVLDTGVAYEDFANFELAPDLANTLFTPGYDFVGNDEHANDDDGHGTHVRQALPDHARCPVRRGGSAPYVYRRGQENAPGQPPDQGRRG